MKVAGMVLLWNETSILEKSIFIYSCLEIAVREELSSGKVLEPSLFLINPVLVKPILLGSWFTRSCYCNPGAALKEQRPDANA